MNTMHMPREFRTSEMQREKRLEELRWTAHELDLLYCYSLRTLR